MDPHGCFSWGALSMGPEDLLRKPIRKRILSCLSGLDPARQDALLPPSKRIAPRCPRRFWAVVNESGRWEWHDSNLSDGGLAMWKSRLSKKNRQAVHQRGQRGFHARGCMKLHKINKKPSGLPCCSDSSQGRAVHAYCSERTVAKEMLNVATCRKDHWRITLQTVPLERFNQHRSVGCTPRAALVRDDCRWVLLLRWVFDVAEFDCVPNRLVWISGIAACRQRSKGMRCWTCPLHSQH